MAAFGGSDVNAPYRKMTMMWLLILVYSPFQIASWSFDTEEACLAKAKELLGTKMEFVAWDTMGGANPIPTVSLAYCAKGYAQRH